MAAEDGYSPAAAAPPKTPHSFQKNHPAGGLNAGTYRSRCHRSSIKPASNSTNDPRPSPCPARLSPPPGTPPKNRFRTEDKRARWPSSSTQHTLCGQPSIHIAQRGTHTDTAFLRSDLFPKSLALENHCLSQRVGLGIPPKDTQTLRIMWTKEHPSFTKSQSPSPPDVAC